MSIAFGFNGQQRASRRGFLGLFTTAQFLTQQPVMPEQKDDRRQEADDQDNPRESELG